MPASARKDILFLGILAFALFGLHVPRAGLHWDDYFFHRTLSAADWPSLWREFLDYVPGRNLYILFYAALYKLVGPLPERLHVVGLVLDALNVFLAYFFLRQMKISRDWILFICGFFLVYPNHGETHFWTSAIAMNLFSMTLLLLSFIVIGRDSWNWRSRAALSLVFFTLALFNYDQIFFMWIPLLAYAWFKEPLLRADPRKLIPWAALCLALNAVHALLRIYAPRSSGGRPMIRFDHFPRAVLHSLTETLIPLRKLPAWDLLSSWAGGPRATLVLITALSLSWVIWTARSWKIGPAKDSPEPGHRMAVFFGGLWFFCAYLPNYFWFISPRHNYLPSLGFLLALSAAVSRLLRRPWMKLPTAGIISIFFALSCASALTQGQAWVNAAALKDKFRSALSDPLFDAVENLFLIGAPVRLKNAPGFGQFGEIQGLFWMATGRKLQACDLTLSPGKTGAFFGNQTELFGAETFQWLDYGRIAAVIHENGDFKCAGTLALTPPGQGRVVVRLPSGKGCRSQASIKTSVWLLSTRLKPASAPTAAPLFTAPNGTSLISLAVAEETNPGWMDVSLSWLDSRPVSRDFAFVLRLFDSENRLVFEPIYRDSTVQKGYLLLWPAYNDIIPPVSRRPTSMTNETFRYKLNAPLPSDRLTAKLALFEKRDSGPWEKMGEYSALVSREP